MPTMYRRAGSALWSDTTMWADTEGGVSNGSVPSATTDVVFGAASNGYTTTVTSGDTCKSINVTVAGHTFVSTTPSVDWLTVWGNCVLGAATVTSLDLWLESTTNGTYTISMGSTWCRNMEIRGSSTSVIWQLGGNFTWNGSCVVTSGKVNVNGYNFTTLSSNGTISFAGASACDIGGGLIRCGDVTVASGCVFTMSGGTIQSYGNVTINSGATVSAATGSIRFTGNAAQAAQLGGKTYGIIENARTTAGSILTFGDAFTCSTFKSVSGVNFSNKFTAGNTYNIGALDAAGACIRSTTTAAYTWNNTSGAQISVADINIEYCTGTGTGGWKATGNWVDVGNNTGWTFQPPGSYRASAFFN
jgi:fibronectin-binding autotransporter adhesin